MSASLAVVPPPSQESARPDIAWIKKNVSVLEVAKALGLRIRHRRAKCWRPENHTHGDAEPSLHFYERKNRVRCFVCDNRGGHSCIDVVMGFLSLDFADAVWWIAERFPVPNVKVGRPAGSASVSPVPYRVGVHGSEWEVIVRSGMWGALTAAERSILFALDHFKAPDTGLTRLSYCGLMRYSGVKMRGSVSRAIKELSRMHALQVSRGPHVGITRECSTYRVTLNDPKFLELCNAVCTSARNEVAQEREYRASLKRERQKAARKSPAPSLRLATQNPHFQTQEQQKARTCEGLNLSSIREPHANKTVLAENREIGSTDLCEARP